MSIPRKYLAESIYWGTYGRAETGSFGFLSLFFDVEILVDLTFLGGKTFHIFGGEMHDCLHFVDITVDLKRVFGVNPLQERVKKPLFIFRPSLIAVKHLSQTKSRRITLSKDSVTSLM
jgi:hypothetical protein